MKTASVSRSRAVVLAVAAATALVAGLTPAAHAQGAKKLQIGGVTGDVIGVGTTGEKVKVGFTVTNHTGKATKAGTAKVVLVGGGHRFGLGTIDYPTLVEGAQKALTATQIPAANVQHGTYQVQVCLLPRPQGACADSGTTTVVIAPPALKASAASLTFPDTATGTPATSQPVTLTNTGPSVTGVISLTLTGADASAFTVGPTGCHKNLAPGATCTPGVVFKPSHTGTSTATLVATGAQGGTASVKLTGTSPTPTTTGLTITPTTFAFPDTAVGQTANNTFTVTNNGSTTTGQLTAVLSGAGASSYKADASTCPTTGLPAGAHCAVTVAFTPTTAGSAPATLTVAGSPGGTTTATLTGKTPTPTSTGLGIDPSSHDYGIVDINSSASFAFTLKNNGTATTGPLTVSLTGAQAGSYSENPGTCETGLAAGATCTITVKYNPTTAGATQATLTVAPTTGTPTTATLNGTTPSALVLSDGFYSFGFYAVGDNSSKAFTLTNTGGATSGIPDVQLAETIGSNGLGVISNGCTSVLAPGASCVITVRFQPTNTGPYVSILKATASPGGEADDLVFGQGAASNVTYIDPSTHDFGSHAVNSSTAFTYDVDNPTGVAGTLSGASSDNANFTIGTISCSNGSTTTLPAHGYCEVEVDFVPSSTGAKSATITFAGTGLTATANGTGA